MNDMPLTLFAWGMEDMRGMIFMAIRITAGVVAFAAGWFLSSPCWRLVYRLAFRQGVPGGLLGVLRLSTAGLVGAGVFFFLPLGGGNGWGWGSGSGGGPGDGTGTGTGTGNQVAKVDPNDKSTNPNPGKTPAVKKREKISIEVLGGENPLYKGDENFYLVQQKEPPQTIEEVEKYVTDNKDRIIVDVVINPEFSDQQATTRLYKMLQKQGILNEQKKAAAK